MILKSITPRNFGPFTEGTTLELEPAVTVLTGPNDTGKTFLLRLIDLICRDKEDKDRFAQDYDVNFDHIHEAKGASWQNDQTIGCIATFTVTQADKPYISVLPGWNTITEIELAVQLAPAAWARRATGIKSTQKAGSPETDLPKMPHVISFPQPDDIREIIDLVNPNPAEMNLLRVALGSGMNLQHLAGLRPALLRGQLRKAQQVLNAEIKKLLPPSVRLEFDLQAVSEKGGRFQIYLSDDYEGYTPFACRGAGTRKLVTLVAALIGASPDSGQVYILIDEPENSLHADAQHALRSFLEHLAERETVQVVYATHSPSMINTMRPESIRLLRRVTKGGKPTSIIVNRPVRENYLPVRASLGLSPADSLLYAPLTIIVEGKSEVMALPCLLNDLCVQKIPGFEEVPKLLSQSHLLDGQGDSFELLCRLAKSQGARAIIFLDGDKIRRVKQQRVEEKHPDVPVITLPEKKELEEVLPEEIYFRALAESLTEDEQRVSPEAFHKWKAKATLPEKMMFTKRVERWLDETFGDAYYDKPGVMKRAAEQADVSEIEEKYLHKFRELVTKMQLLLSGEDATQPTQ